MLITILNRYNSLRVSVQTHLLPRVPKGENISVMRTQSFLQSFFRSFFFVLGPLSIVTLSSLSTGVAQTNVNPRVKSVPVHTESFITKIIELTNLERVKAGVPPLKRQDDLCKAAHWLAADMATNNYFQHADRAGRNIDSRLPYFGYKDFSTIGENIAAGQITPAVAVADWMKSPGHRANLLSPDFCEIGVGYVHVPNSESQDYWVQDFGSRASIFPLIINLESPQTTTPDVKLYVHGVKWAQKARFSNDGIHWTAWESFSTSRDWHLETKPGKQSVYVEMSDGKETRRASASIELLAPASLASVTNKTEH